MTKQTERRKRCRNAERKRKEETTSINPMMDLQNQKNAPENFSVTLEDGTEQQYSLKSLKEEDVAEWARFCASCFAYKANPPPPAYFERHYYNDPQRDASLITVVCCGGDEDGGGDRMVASTRIFLRTLACANDDASVGTTVVKAGGIGEVCTHPTHRKRGLARRLLHRAIKLMKERQMVFSVLHASAELTSVYERSANYESVLTRWSVLRMNGFTTCSSKDSSSTFFHSVRQAVFPDDTERLMKIHQEYSEQRFAGCVIRSEAYWNDYLSKELHGSLFCLVSSSCSSNSESGIVIGWISIRPRGARYQVREFGCDTEKISAGTLIPILLERALSNQSVTFGEGKIVEISMPTAILEDIKQEKELPSCFDTESVVSEDDIGWMYKSLQDGGRSLNMVNVAKRREHLLWPSDSF